MKFTHINTLIYATLVQAVANAEEDSSILLRPIAGSRKSYSRPEKKTRNKYVANTPGKVISADVDISATKPVLNLNEYNDISNVTCTADSITVSFSTEDAKNAAFEVWSKESDMAVLANECPTMILQKIVSADVKTLVIDAKEITASELFEEISLVFDQTSKQIHKREIVLDADGDADFDLNYDVYKAGPQISNFTLYNNEDGSATCKDCYSVGQINARIELTMGFGHVKRYELRIWGGVRGNFDLIVTKSGTKKLHINELISSKVLERIYIPYIFELRPEIYLRTEFSYDSPANTATWGFDYDYPFDMTMNTTNFLIPVTVTHNPTDTQKKLNIHRFDLTEDIAMKAVGQITPAAGYEFSLFGQDIFGFKMFHNNTIDVALKQNTSPDIDCPAKGLRFETYKQQETIIEFTIGDYPPITPYSSGKVSFMCFFCSKCLNPDNSATTTTKPSNNVTTTTKISTTTTEPSYISESTSTPGAQTTTKPKCRHHH
jgi:hypothetical protein